MLPNGNVEDVGGVGGSVRSSSGEVAAEVELYLDDRRSGGIWIYLVNPLLRPWGRSTRRRKDAIEAVWCIDAGLNGRFAVGSPVGMIVTEQRGSDQLEEFQLSSRERERVTNSTQITRLLLSSSRTIDPSAIPPR